jgi:predicted amidohydrolase YtcJ
VWLDSDPRTTPPLELPAIQVRATYLGGRSVYSATG